MMLGGRFWRGTKRWTLLLAAWLIPAVMGTFTFATAQNLDTSGFSQSAAAGTVNVLDGDGVILPNEPEIDWLYENHALSKAHGRSSFSARHAPLRAFAGGFPHKMPFVLQTGLVILYRAGMPDTLYTPPLKLRI